MFKRRLAVAARDMSAAEAEAVCAGFEAHIAESVALRASLLPLAVPGQAFAACFLPFPAELRAGAGVRRSQQIKVPAAVSECTQEHKPTNKS